jgi:hypothetical protein
VERWRVEGGGWRVGGGGWRVEGGEVEGGGWRVGAVAELQHAAHLALVAALGQTSGQRKSEEERARGARRDGHLVGLGLGLES